MSQVKVGVVVLAWNAAEQAAAAVRSALAQDYSSLFIVVVDNGSLASHRDALRNEFASQSRVHFLALDQNRGYAGGNNAGAAWAFDQGADLVLILTQDATLHPAALSALVEVAVREQAALVGPRVLNSAPPHDELSCGERVTTALLCLPRRWLRYRRAHGAAFAVTGIMGCVLLISRTCWQQTQGFDETFFAYYEEVDLCLRVRRHGGSIWCVPTAIATHDGIRGFAAGFMPNSAQLKARNLVWTMRRHARAIDWLLLLPTWVLLMSTSLVLYALRRRFDVVVALLRGAQQGWWSALARPPSSPASVRP